MLLPSFVHAFLAPMRFRNIRFLGGKFGAQIESEWNHSTVKELRQVSLEQLRDRFGQEGEWLYHLLRGIDHQEVSERTANSSMMSAKHFRPGISTTDEVLSWLSTMSSELSTRLEEERIEYPLLTPRTLVLRYLLADAKSPKSHQTHIGFVHNESLLEEIKKRAHKLWNENMGKVMEKALQGQVQVMILSLSFANMDHGSKDQQQLHGFLAPLPCKRGPTDDHPASSKKRKSSPISHPYHIVQDPDSQSDMVAWFCTRCDQVMKVPVFQDTVETNSSTGEPEYVTILGRMRKEHEHWHMALDWAAETELSER